MTPALDLPEAQSRLLALANPVDVEFLRPQESAGRFLAVPLTGAWDRPALPTSAMDGFAVDADDLVGPWTVIGEAAAGHPFSQRVEVGTAVRISTGAIVPSGAGAVILQEDVAREGTKLRLSGEGPSRAAQHIRPAGGDFKAGTELLEAGSRLTPAAIALALSSGQAALMVRRLVKIAFLDCGDELVTPPDTCDPHQVPASNAAMLAAMLDRLPATAMISAPVPDRIDAFVNALDAARDADVIVTTGGASVGDHDVTRPALEQWGAQLDFWRVAIKPGKPLLVARRGSQIVLGLPGNPVSAFVTAFFFLLPLVRAMSGAAQCLPKPETLPLAADLPPSGGRREFVRGVVTEAGALALASQDSGGLLALSQATILIERPPQASAARSGTPVPVYRLQNGGIA